MATLEAERVAVTAAAAMAEDALSLQREALAVLVEGWDGQSGSAAADLLSRQCADRADVVTAMQEVAGELALLRDSLADPVTPPPGPFAPTVRLPLVRVFRRRRGGPPGCPFPRYRTSAGRSRA